jgi:hypothetical protein
MSRQRLSILQKVSQNLRQGTTIDVYELVNLLRSEYPDVPEAELVRIISEEAIAAGASACWVKWKG